MPSVPSRLQRAAAASTIAAGLGLLAVSASGIAALQSDLEAATKPAPPSRLVEDRRTLSAPDERPCRRPDAAQTVGPEV
jgi:hypothetical protein